MAVVVCFQEHPFKLFGYVNDFIILLSYHSFRLGKINLNVSLRRKYVSKLKCHSWHLKTLNFISTLSSYSATHLTVAT